MAHHTFSKKEAILFGWNTFKKNWKFLLAVFVVAAILQGMTSNFQGLGREQVDSQNILLLLVGVVIQALVTIGTIVISLKFVDRKKPEFSDLVKHYRYLVNYLLVFLMLLPFTIIFGAIQGWVILLLPIIIYFAIRFQFYSYFIVDKDMGPIESLKASYRITKGHVMNLFLLGLLFAGIMILGFIALLVGVLVAWPVVSLAGAYVYRKLSHKG